MNSNPLCRCESFPCFSVSFLRMLGPKERVYLENHKQEHRFRKGETIFQEGDTPNSVKCLRSGKIKIYKLGAQGQQQIVRLVKPGDLLGYRSVLSKTDYNATAGAIEDSIVCCFPKEDFCYAMDTSLSLSHHLLERICEDLRFAEDHLLDFIQKPARERVATTLLLLFKAYGVQTGQQMLIDASLTRKEIAELSGIVLETAVRHLSVFRKNHLIDFNGKKIKILDMKALQRMANFDMDSRYVGVLS